MDTTPLDRGLGGPRWATARLQARWPADNLAPVEAHRQARWISPRGSSTTVGSSWRALFRNRCRLCAPAGVGWSRSTATSPMCDPVARSTSRARAARRRSTSWLLGDRGHQNVNRRDRCLVEAVPHPHVPILWSLAQLRAVLLAAGRFPSRSDKAANPGHHRLHTVAGQRPIRRGPTVGTWTKDGRSGRRMRGDP